MRWPVEFVSDNVQKLLGYTALDFISGEVAYRDIIHQEDRQRVTEEVIEFSQDISKNSFTHQPYRVLTKEGQIKWLEDNMYIRRNARGLITHYQGIVLDISDRVQMEKELDNHRLGLEKLVKERTLELTAANELLKEEINDRKKIDQALSDSEGNIAVYLKTPMKVFVLLRRI